MIKLRMRSDIEVLLGQYELLVEDASKLEKINPKMSIEKLRQASKIEIKIEELKLSKYN